MDAHLGRDIAGGETLGAQGVEDRWTNSPSNRETYAIGCPDQGAVIGKGCTPRSGPRVPRP